MAAVGQASMQRVQVPQRSGGGESGSRSRVVSSSPRKNHEPAYWLIRQVFCPIQPSPASRARALQKRRGIDAGAPLEGVSFPELSGKLFKFFPKL